MKDSTETCTFGCSSNSNHLTMVEVWEALNSDLNISSIGYWGLEMIQSMSS